MLSRERIEKSRSLSAIDVYDGERYIIKFRRVRRRTHSWNARSRARTISRAARIIVWKAEQGVLPSQRWNDDNDNARSVTQRLFIHRSMIFRTTEHARDCWELLKWFVRERRDTAAPAGEQKRESEWGPNNRLIIIALKFCPKFSSWDTGCRFDLTGR